MGSPRSSGRYLATVVWFGSAGVFDRILPSEPAGESVWAAARLVWMGSPRSSGRYLATVVWFGSAGVFDRIPPGEPAGEERGW